MKTKKNKMECVKVPEHESAQCAEKRTRTRNKIENTNSQTHAKKKCNDIGSRENREGKKVTQHKTNERNETKRMQLRQRRRAGEDCRTRRDREKKYTTQEKARI